VHRARKGIGYTQQSHSGGSKLPRRKKRKLRVLGGIRNRHQKRGRKRPEKARMTTPGGVRGLLRGQGEVRGRAEGRRSVRRQRGIAEHRGRRGRGAALTRSRRGRRGCLGDIQRVRPKLFKGKGRGISSRIVGRHLRRTEKKKISWTGALSGTRDPWSDGSSVSLRAVRGGSRAAKVADVISKIRSGVQC